MDESNWKKMFNSIWKREGDSFIQFLLDAGLEVNTLNKYGTTMMSNAAERGNLEIIELLVQKGADCNATNIVGSKPLHIAAKYGHKDAVKFFLDRGTFIDSSDNNGDTPLHYIAAKRNIPVADKKKYRKLLRFLVERQADLNAENLDGCTPLLLAARNSDKLLFESFIELTAKVNSYATDKWTALHFFCEKGWLDVVKLLLSKGYDLNAETYRRRTPLLVAANNSHLSVVEFLIESGAVVKNSVDWTVLHFASRNGWLGVVKYLVNKGCNPDAKTSSGRTPLLLAAENSHLSVVEYLIESGADVKCRDYNGSTMLHRACKFGWLNIVKSLVDENFDLNAKNNFDGRALQYAISNCDFEIIESLLKAGKMGAYVMLRDYYEIFDEPLLRELILQDTELCTRAVLNKFNNYDLPEIYEIPVVAKRLPAIDKLKIATHTNVAQDIARCVEREIQTNGYCNILKARPIILSSLCVTALYEAFGMGGIWLGPYEFVANRYLEVKF